MTPRVPGGRCEHDQSARLVPRYLPPDEDAANRIRTRRRRGYAADDLGHPHLAGRLCRSRASHRRPPRQRPGKLHGTATRTHEPSLYRVLRLLAALGVLDDSVQPRSFGLTALGDRLRSDAPACVRSWAVFLEALGGVRPFEHILHTVRTGEPGFGQAQGMEIFEFLAQNPRSAAIFDAAMSERTAAFAPSVADSYDFADIRTVIDVGGGTGTLLVEILRKHAHLHGVLFETPAVAARANAVLDAIDLGDRRQILAGDFFENVPEGADCYLLANVLHDWDDAQAGQILRNCRQAMTRGGRVLIVERLISDAPGDAVPTLLSDINMLVITGGQERTNAEYGDLLATAGLTIGEVHPVAFPYGIIEGLPA
jgi:hypothetical protein